MRITRKKKMPKAFLRVFFWGEAVGWLASVIYVPFLIAFKNDY